MTSPKIDSSSFTLNDFLHVYLNFILLPYSKRENFSMAMKSEESRFKKQQDFVTFDLRNLFILSFTMAYSSRFFTEILLDVVPTFLLIYQRNQQNNTSFYLN